MELKQRKKLHNLPRRDQGQEGLPWYNLDPQNKKTHVWNNMLGEYSNNKTDAPQVQVPYEYPNYWQDISGQPTIKGGVEKLNTQPSVESAASKFAKDPNRIINPNEAYKAAQPVQKPETVNGITALQPDSQVPYDGNKVEIKPSAGQKISSVVSGVSSLASNFINQQSMVKDTGELMRNAGSTQSSAGGVGYVEQNAISGNNEMSALDSSGLGNTLSSTASGAAAGATFGPYGAIIGGVVGLASGLIGWSTSKSKLRKRIYNAQQLASRNNAGARAGAMSIAMKNNYANNHSGLTGGTLYANKGKDKWQRI